MPLTLPLSCLVLPTDGQNIPDEVMEPTHLNSKIQQRSRKSPIIYSVEQTSFLVQSLIHETSVKRTGKQKLLRKNSHEKIRESKRKVQSKKSTRKISLDQTREEKRMARSNKSIRKTSLDRIREQRSKLQKASRKTSINRIMEQTFTLSNGTTRNKDQVKRFADLVKQVVKALSGHNYHFVHQAEFYHDLKETLHKIYCHISMCGNRQKVVQLMMTKKDNQFYDEMKHHIDALCGRIFLANACRMSTRKKNGNCSHSRR